jgi:hypothetical protein
MPDFDLDPCRATASFIRPLSMLGNDSFKTNLTSLIEKARANRAGLMIVVKDAVGGAFQEFAKPQLRIWSVSPR